MGELVLKIGASSTFDDADIIEAFSPRRISRTHLESICKPQGFNSDGLRIRNTLPEIYLEKTAKAKLAMRAVGLIHTDLVTGVETALTPDPVKDGLWWYADGNHIWWDQFIAKRRKHPNHRVFGRDNREVFYDQTRSRPDATIVHTDIWNEVEARTAIRRINRLRFPLNRRERSVFLPMRVQAFTDAQAGEWLRPETEPYSKVDTETGHVTETERVVRNRRFRVPYDAIMDSLTVAKIRDRTLEHDERETERAVSLIEAKV